MAIGNQSESMVDPNGLAVIEDEAGITYTGDDLLGWWNDNVIRDESGVDGGISKAREALELMRALERMINATMSLSPDGGGIAGGSGFLIRMYERAFKGYIRNSIIVSIGYAAGNDPGQEGGKDNDEKYVPPSSHEITPFELGWEWLTGQGPRHRDFIDGDYMTELLKKHSHVKETKDKVLDAVKNGAKEGKTGSNGYSLGGIEGVGLYVKDYSTLLTGGATGNLAVTYLGSYNLKWQIMDITDKTVIVRFSVHNTSTMQSASRPPVIGYIPGWQESIGKWINSKFQSGWGSKTSQTFIWTEILNR